MTRRAKILALVVIGVLAAAGVYLHVLTGRVSYQEEAPSEESARTRLAESALGPLSGPATNVTLYFPAPNEGALVQENRPITLATGDIDRIRQIVLALIEGSQQGLRRPLPASTELLAVFLTSDGTAYLDFAGNALTLFEPGIGSETLAVYSLVDSICANIPSVKRVRILVQGREVETLNGHADLTEAFVPDTGSGSPQHPATPAP